MHVFGDSISCTATNPTAGPLYFGKSYSNGKTWVEALAQMQGLPFDPLKDNPHSYFGNTSSNLLTQIAAYTPPEPGSALVVIWVNNADMYYPATKYNPKYADFTSATTKALANQFKAITNLYAKGIRTLIMPNVVDISSIPQFNNYTAYTNLFRQASTNYNAQFYSMLDNARAACPGLNIVAPDYFRLLSDMLANAAGYGLTNALFNSGNGLLSIDALSNPNLANKALNGPGANYVFWDPTDPTAKVHYIMAAVAQQMVSPVRISRLVVGDSSNRLDLVNLPVGMTGMVEGCTNLQNDSWAVVSDAFIATNAAQSLLVPVPVSNPDTNLVYAARGEDWSGPFPPNTVNPEVTIKQLYRVCFPYAWVWP